MATVRYPSIRERLKKENPGASAEDLEALVTKEVNSMEQSQESKEKWADMLASWKNDPSTVVRVQGSQWYGPKYSRQLADYPGDPKAYVSSANQVREKAKRKGLIGEHTDFEVRT